MQWTFVFRAAEIMDYLERLAWQRFKSGRISSVPFSSKQLHYLQRVPTLIEHMRERQ
jgi:hypothetical protein